MSYLYSNLVAIITTCDNRKDYSLIIIKLQIILQLVILKFSKNMTMVFNQFLHNFIRENFPTVITYHFLNNIVLHHGHVFIKEVNRRRLK